MIKWRSEHPEYRDYQRKYQKRYTKTHSKEAVARATEWYRLNMERAHRNARRSNLGRKFKFSLEQFERLLIAQEGVCAICLKPCITGEMLSVDHCHLTGKVRGLLCRKCNSAIGLLSDSPEMLRKALLYLERHQ